MLNLDTKSGFAKRIGVSPGRVSQMIAEGKIGDCLVGAGRDQKIDVNLAIEKLKLRTDPGQRVGNGAATNLTEPIFSDAIAPQRGSEADEIDLKLKRERLSAAEAQNRKAREEELARRGIYVRAEHATAEGGKLASVIMQMFEGGLTEIAAEIADTFKLPARDVKHLMRNRFRQVRTSISAKLAMDAAAQPMAIDDDSTDTPDA